VLVLTVHWWPAPIRVGGLYKSPFPVVLAMRMLKCLISF
jgi:hypothetical protein